MRPWTAPGQAPQGRRCQDGLDSDPQQTTRLVAGFSLHPANHKGTPTSAAEFPKHIIAPGHNTQEQQHKYRVIFRHICISVPETYHGTLQSTLENPRLMR